MSNQQSFPDWVNDAAGALSNGAFPHHNQAQRVGQVCPNNYMQDGFTFKPTSNAGNVLKINLKTVFDSGRGKPTVSYITVVAFGKTAEHIVDQLAPGDIIAVEGRLGFYKSTNGQSYPQIVVDDYNGACFWWVGEHAIEQHDDAQQGGGNGRGGRGNGNGGGNGGGGGRSNYGNRGGSGGQQGGGGQNNGGSREQAGSGGRGRQAGGSDRQPSGGNQQGRGGQQGGNANAGGPNRGRGRDYDQPAPSQQGRNNQQGGNGGYDRGPSNDDHRNTSTNHNDDHMPIDEDDIPF